MGDNAQKAFRLNFFTIKRTIGAEFVIEANGQEYHIDCRKVVGAEQIKQKIAMNLIVRLQINRDNNPWVLYRGIKKVGNVAEGFTDPDNTYYLPVPTGTFYDAIEMVQCLCSLMVEHVTDPKLPKYVPGGEFAMLNGDDTNEKGRYGDWAALYFAVYSAQFIGIPAQHITMRIGNMWDHEAIYNFKNPGYAFFVYSLVPELFDNYDGWKCFFRRMQNPYLAVADLLDHAFGDYVKLERTGDHTLDKSTNCTSGYVAGDNVIGNPQSNPDTYDSLDTELLRAQTAYVDDRCSARGLPKNMILLALNFFQGYNIIAEGLFPGGNETSRARIRLLQYYREMTQFVVPLKGLGNSVVYDRTGFDKIELYPDVVAETSADIVKFAAGDRTTHDHAVALQRLHEATGGVFLNTPSREPFCWDGVLLAGGLPSQAINAAVKNIAAASDIDLFIYGKTPEERTAVFTRVLTVLNAPAVATHLADGQGVNETLFCVTGSVCTVLHPAFTRPIQIIFSDATTPTCILSRFDLTACQVGFDGRDFLMTPHAVESFATRIAMVSNCDRIIYSERYVKIVLQGFQLAKHQALTRLGVEERLINRDDLDMLWMSAQTAPYIPPRFTGNTDADLRQYRLKIKVDLSKLPKNPERTLFNPDEAVTQTAPDSNFSSYRVASYDQVKTAALSCQGVVIRMGTHNLVFSLPRSTIVSFGEVNYGGNVDKKMLKYSLTVTPQVTALLDEISQWWDGAGPAVFGRRTGKARFTERFEGRDTVCVHMNIALEKRRREQLEAGLTTKLPMLRRTDNQGLLPEMVMLGDDSMMQVRIVVIECRNGREREWRPHLVMSSAIVYEKPIVISAPDNNARPKAIRGAVPITVNF